MTDARKQPQTQKILAYMERFGSITPLDALREFGCMRLGARIWDLKHDGVAIRTETEQNVNAFGETVRYARYRLEGGAENVC